MNTEVMTINNQNKQLSAVQIQPGTRPTHDILIEFEIRLKFGKL